MTKRNINCIICGIKLRHVMNDEERVYNTKQGWKWFCVSCMEKAMGEMEDNDAKDD